VDDDFGVATAMKHVALGFEFPAQLLEIVDLAVKDNGQGSVFVEKRLVAGDEVDDGQPAMGQPRAAALGKGVEMDALPVRAAMGQDAVHGPEHLAKGFRAALVGEKTANAAHGCAPSSTLSRRHAPRETGMR